MKIGVAVGQHILSRNIRHDGECHNFGKSTYRLRECWNPKKAVPMLVSERVVWIPPRDRTASVKVITNPLAQVAVPATCVSFLVCVCSP